ncbi:diaminopimelate decarboxylase [Halorhodospira halophila]|uniref:Diaminopimelate decarboxylase n=1 Tax=Halorhodospira halophila (strain DSM 244 / SL1) TaxID=349124 RepID=A1WWB2_HALHL|nr:diaminopimelate decarboxylase [Halorhodospira halophila]ABM61974.1 diaminopimelate decarboxylase [Halorhodospira halophila SL1]MBK1729698.1 diaminopimelate decarboxylase [Halorhodospira halophila]
MSTPPGFARYADRLWAEALPLDELAERFGTPCYVYSRAAIEERWALYRSALGVAGDVCYAVKANGNLALLQLLARHGAGFDIVSGGELERVLHAGGDAARVVFSGVGKGTDEIRRALQAGIRCFNVESAAELERIASVAATENTPAPVALRVNPDVNPETHPYIATGLAQSKFGIALEEAEALYLQAANDPRLEVRGIACHIGSQLLSVAPLTEAAERLAALARRLQEQGISLDHIDAGGGLGVHYIDEQPPTPAEHIEAISAPLRDLGVSVLVEPGRAIVAEAGILLTRIEYLKHNGGKEFAIVDAGMNDYLRPALYDAAHTLEAVTPSEAELRPVDVVGPVCESADTFARDCTLPAAAGGLLAIRSAGAYGAVMASQYNARPRPPEVLVDGTQAHLIRRRETIDELMSGESLLPEG